MVFLSFIIPLMILAYVTMGIANLKSGAGKLLLITVILAYLSTLAAGSASFLVADTLFPSFMSDGALEQIAATAGNSLESYFSLEIPPLFDTLSAVVLAFVLGLCLSTLRGKTIGDTLYNGMSDFSGVIDQVLHSVIIPLLPLYICIFLQFLVAGAVSRKNPFRLIRNQIPGYITALGTQSSAATIPVNLQCAEADGVSAEIRNFVVPLCANIHMAGSMITITACSTAVCLMNQIPISLATVIPFMGRRPATPAAPSAPSWWPCISPRTPSAPPATCPVTTPSASSWRPSIRNSSTRRLPRLRRPSDRKKERLWPLSVSLTCWVPI